MKIWARVPGVVAARPDPGLISFAPSGFWVPIRNGRCYAHQSDRGKGQRPLDSALVCRSHFRPASSGRFDQLHAVSRSGGHHPLH
jgi:hypothetical protein